MTTEADKFRAAITKLAATAKQLQSTSRVLEELIQVHLKEIPAPVLEAWMTHYRMDTANLKALNEFLGWSLAYFTEHPL